MPRATPLSAEERRAAIIVATEPLLARRGQDVSTREIAEAAGVAEGTIFRVFPTKEVLIEAVVEDAFGLDAVGAELARIDLTLELETRMIQVAELLHRRLTRVVALLPTLAARRCQPGPSGPGSRSGSSSPDSAGSGSFRIGPDRREREQRVIQAAVAAVLAPDADRLRVPPLQAARLLSAMLMSAAHPLLPGHPRPEPRQVVAILLHGIVAAPPEDPAC